MLCFFKGLLFSLDVFRRHLVPNICWLQKQISQENVPQLCLLEFSASQKLTDSRAIWYLYGTDLKDFMENLKEKSHNSLIIHNSEQEIY